MSQRNRGNPGIMNNAAAAGGNEARSTSSRRVVFAIAPIKPAVAASRKGLLNITENP